MSNAEIAIFGKNYNNYIFAKTNKNGEWALEIPAENRTYFNMKISSQK